MRGLKLLNQITNLKAFGNWLESSLKGQALIFFIIVEIATVVYCRFTFNLLWVWASVTTAIVGVLLALLFLLHRVSRTVFYLTLPDYCTNIARIILGAILLDIILEGPVPRISEQVSSIQNSTECVQELVKGEFSRNYQEGLKQIQSKVLGSLTSLNRHTKELSEAIKGATANVDKAQKAFENLVNDSRAMYKQCDARVRSAFNDCEKESKGAKRKCGGLGILVKDLCNMVDVSTHTCNGLRSIDICKPISVTTEGVAWAYDQVRNVVKDIYKIFRLDVKFSANGNVNGTVENGEIREELQRSVKEWLENVNLVRAVIGVVVGLLLILKPMLNAGMLMRKSKNHEEFQYSGKVLAIKMCFSVVTIMGMIFIYLTELLLGKFTCLSRSTLMSLNASVAGSFNTSLDVGGGFVADFLARIVVTSFNEGLDLKVKLDIDECLPECQERTYFVGEYFGFGLSALLILITFAGDVKAVEVKNKLLAFFRMDDGKGVYSSIVGYNAIRKQ